MLSFVVDTHIIPALLSLFQRLYLSNTINCADIHFYKSMVLKTIC